MAATAVTYRTGTRRSDLRTVIVEGVHTVVLATGGTKLLAAKLLHGTQCAHSCWDEVLGTEGDDFVVPQHSVVQVREICVAVKGTHKRGSV